MALALVTGASSGIGHSLAALLAERKTDLVITARHQAALVELAADLQARHAVKVVAKQCDLAETDGPVTLAASLAAGGLEPDILVNNAGFGTFGRFLDQSIESQLQIIQLNIRALVELTRLLAPKMVERRRGRILNVASTAAFQPGPMMAVYYASKAFVLHFSEALGNELEGSGVTVTALCPGPTATGFQDRAGMRGLRLLTIFPPMNADRVAREALDGMAVGKRIVITGMFNRLMALGTRISPRSFTTRVVRSIHEKG